MAETLEDLRRVAERLGPEAFCARYPHPFLVRLDERGGPDEPAAWAFAMEITAPGEHRAPTPLAGRLARVHDLIKSSGKGGRDSISVGRDSRNDVVVAEMSISRTHVTFRLGLERDWHVVDGGSRNGVRINGRKLSPRVPASIRSGDVLSLGDVTFLFVWPDDLLTRLPGLCADWDG